MCGFQQQDDLPMFGRICNIKVITATSILSIRLFNTIGINNHLQCYAIENAHHTFLTLVTHLVHPEPLSAHQQIGDDNVYIALRSYIPNIQ